ncbi:MAG: VOC family protein [Bdellovibrionales bacterium]|nr:VOC family protein [Bdellovibrionales bacterium]
MSLNAIGIVSKDISTSIKFYQLLGVDLKRFNESSDHFEGVTPSGVRIMVDSIELVKKINPKWVEPSGTGVSLCFKQSSVKSVDELYSKIIQAGFQSVKAPWDAFWGQRYCSVLDPDGNQIDLFADL